MIGDLVVIVLVALAAGFVLRRLLRTLAAARGGCGCAKDLACGAREAMSSPAGPFRARERAP